MDTRISMDSTPWYVYLLKSSGGSTYVGATVDVNRRLRQHRGELSGGARATARKNQKGEEWNRVCFVGPFEKRDALRFEWRWKHTSRKLKGSPMERRWLALERLLEEQHCIYFEDFT